MIETEPLSGDPANDDGLVGVLLTAIQKSLQQTDDMLPAVVIAYDRATNRATVRPQIRMRTTNGDHVTRAQIASVPVLNIGGGGFLLSFPIKAGDLGWIKASDRDISLYLQGGAEQEEGPNTKRMHSFQDGLFIPDTLRQFTIDGEDAERVVLQSLDGTTRIALGDGLIRIVTPGAVEIESGTLTHNGVNIGSDHIHPGVQAGGASTGPPE